MIRTLIAPFALALALSAGPALAKESPNARALDQHFASLETPETGDCFAFDELDAATRQDRCETAIEKLAAARAAKRNPSIGETANFDYRLVALQAGLSAAYAEQDAKFSQRGCDLIESNMVIRNRLKAIPESELSADAFDTYQNPPENFLQVVAMCRKEFGTPRGAPALPN